MGLPNYPTREEEAQMPENDPEEYALPDDEFDDPTAEVHPDQSPTIPVDES